jgi:ATP-binding cassette subfamily F protein 3
VNGGVSYHPQTKTAYFEQANTALLRDAMTVEEEIVSSLPELERRKARDICGAMMFPGDDALKPVSILSGGEKCRVLLGKLLAAPSNLLLLDEPTHHLDMQSSESLMEAIEEFSGAVVLVTHNERIIYHVATKLIVFLDDRILFYPGTYREFLEDVGWENPTRPAQAALRVEAGNAGGEWKERKAQKKERAEFINRRSRVLTPLKQTLDELEAGIARLEQAAESNLKLLLEASERQEILKMAELAKAVERANRERDALFEKYIATHETFDIRKAAFDEEEKNFL